MNKDDILHLGTLARIKITDQEVDQLSDEFAAILEYVSSISDVVTDEVLEKKVGVVHNVFRADEVTNEPGAFTEALLAAAPERDGQYVRVKKILNTDE